MMLLPVLRIEPRIEPLGGGELALRAAAGVAIAVIIGAALLLATGHNPVAAFAAIARGAFGSVNALSGTLNKSVPIALCAIGFAITHRAKIWNIGGEGQLYFGAFAATGVGLVLPADTPMLVAMPAVLVAGFAAGAVWAGIAAVLRAHLGVNEILTTLMLNYIAINWVGYIVSGPWADPMTFTLPYSAPIVEGAQLGRIFANVHFGVVIMLVAAVGLFLLDLGSRFGYELRVVGDAPRAALYAGIGSKKLIILAMLASGAMAGLAGAVEIAGSTFRLQAGLSPGYGFMAVMVACLAGGRPLPIILCSVLYAGLLNGGFALQVSGIPPSIGTILQACLLLAILGVVTMGRYRIRFAARKGQLV